MRRLAGFILRPAEGVQRSRAVGRELRRGEVAAPRSTSGKYLLPQRQVVNTLSTASAEP